MSGIAEVLLNLGYQVSGSDLAENAATQRLEKLGAKVAHRAWRRTTSAAPTRWWSRPRCSADNPEVLAARARRIPVVPRALMLAELMRLKQGIAIAGTHGKTTTTSLVASVLAEGGLDPTFVIGGRLNARRLQRAPRRRASSSWSRRTSPTPRSCTCSRCWRWSPTSTPTTWRPTSTTSRALKQAFVEFLQNLPFYGSAILCVDDANVREILPFVSKPVVTYGFARGRDGRAPRASHAGGRDALPRVREGTPGALDVHAQPARRHNVQNALAAIAVGTELRRRRTRRSSRRWRSSAASAGASSATATCRCAGGGSFALIDDYGHHPAEMAATLAAARGAFPGRRLVLAFQPHRYTRTRDLFEDFVRVLSTADALLLAEVYPAGEAPIVAADGRALARAVRVAGQGRAGLRRGHRRDAGGDPAAWRATATWC